MGIYEKVYRSISLDLALFMFILSNVKLRIDYGARIFSKSEHEARADARTSSVIVFGNFEPASYGIAAKNQ